VKTSRVLVTGAAGFIGGHLVDALTADGIQVRAFDRPGARRADPPNACAEVVEGNILDRDALRRSMRDVDTVFHLAAISRHDARVPDTEYEAVNVEGTRRVLEEASAAGVRRVLFTGTIEAVGMSRDGRPLTEATPQHPRNIYGQTKLEAEKLVLSYRPRTRMDTVVVRPPMTYGPREMLLLPRLFKVIEKGVYPLIGSGQALTEFCYVGNQVRGIRLAAERGRSGEAYFISDERSYTLEEVVDAIAAELGVRVWKPHIPVPAALLIGLGFELLSKVFRFYPFLIPQTGRPPFSRKTVAWTAESRLFVDISKARRDLGYQPGYGLAEGVRETVRWYREHGFLGSKR
jgi:nucleoside-diphosphate-sugar epimerase